MASHADLAIQFLTAARAGDRATAARLVTTTARHHNPYFAAGMPALIDAIVAASVAAPDGTLDVKHTLADADLVAVHSHVVHTPGEPGFATLHLFRFEGDLIAEMWDLGQAIPADNKNSDGMF